MTKLKKVIEDGRIAVITSNYADADWYTCNLNKPQCLFSPEIVGLLQASKSIQITLELCQKLFGEDFNYEIDTEYQVLECWLSITWVEQGQAFTIDYHEGVEEVRLGFTNQFITDPDPKLKN